MPNIVLIFGVLNNLKRRSLFIRMAAFFLLILFLTDPCFSEERNIPKDAFVTCGISDARILIPFLADDTSSSSICGLIYSGLTKVDKNLNIVGDLAKDWKVEKGGLEITFYLLENVSWQDGYPFTAKDVYFTYNTILDPNMACPYVSSFSGISRIEIINSHTIKFYFTRPYAPALLKFGMGIIPEHIFGAIKDLHRIKNTINPVGTGEYKLSRWKREEFMVLNSNYKYFDGPPNIDKYVWRIIPDQSIQFLELISGGIDSMGLTPYQYVYRSDTKEFTGSNTKFEYLQHAYTYIGYNFEDSLFKDKRVRQALSYAINKKEIIQGVLLGLGEECTGPFIKGSKYYNPKAREYAYNVSKAKELLSDAGWEDVDSDGILEKDGEEFSIILATNQGNQLREDIATIVQGQWKKIGIKVEIQVLSWAAFLDEFIHKKKFQAVILGWSLPIDPDIYSVWHSNSIKDGGLNFISYSNQDVDLLIEEGRGEFDDEKRAKIYKEIHSIIAEEAPYTFLFTPKALVAVNNRFAGIDPSPYGIFHNFNDWNVDNKEVKYKF